MSDQQPIGLVLRGSTTGFVCGTRTHKLDTPQFGAFVEAPCGNGAERAIGLIHGIQIDDDPLVRQLILADNVTQQTREDQRVNRMVPVEISVINIGYVQKQTIHQALPPRPPLSLAEVTLCRPDAIRTFCERLDFFRLVLNAPEAPTDELLAASLRLASGTFGGDDERSFLVRAGRELAKHLAQDLARLQNILRHLQHGL